MSDHQTNQETIEKAMATAYRHLAARDRTEQEIRDRLHDKGFDANIIDHCVAELTSMGYLNDEEYAVDYLRAGLARGKGLLRLHSELGNKGIDRNTIEDAVYLLEDRDDIQVADVESATALMIARSVVTGDFDKKTENRIFRKLMNAGYRQDTCYSVLRILRDESREMHE